MNVEQKLIVYCSCLNNFSISTPFSTHNFPPHSFSTEIKALPLDQIFGGPRLSTVLSGPKIDLIKSPSQWSDQCPMSKYSSA